MKLKDAQGFSPLHHLAKNNTSELANEAIRDMEDKEDGDGDDNYYYRNGKKIKTRSYNHRIRLRKKTKDEEVVGYYAKEEDKKEFEKKVKILDDVLIKCATMLIKESLSVQDKTESDEMTPLFIAIMC